MIKIHKMSKAMSYGTSLQGILLTLLISLFACSDNQNNFVPFTKVDKYISLVNYNNLYISGNSMTFPGDGYAGLIVICISDQQYLAFDACCPFEGARNSVIETNPGQAGIVSSSNPIATCKVCGSQYILFSGGYPTKGPSARNLKQYQVTALDNRLWIHN
jgi:nitrite reductase/ring-hydroxylating ferredoxin subunit